VISAKTFAKYATSPSDFRDDLVIDVDGSAKRLGAVLQPWQAADFAALDPALQRCNGRRPDAEGPARFYFERPRGSSKTTDLAVVAVWALCFATRPIRGFCFAADRDQAAILKDAVATLCRLNKWVNEIVEVQKDKIICVATDHPGQGGQIEIFTSDVASSYGILPDLVIADELCHWEGDGSLWHSIISSAAKRATCVCVIISNAGFCDSWQHGVREIARTDDAWHFSRLESPPAWMTEKRLDEQRRMLPAVAFARLWLNEWSSGGGDALTKEDIAAAFQNDLGPHLKKQAGWRYVLGCDLSLTRDCSSVILLAVPDGGRAGSIRLARARLWRPVPGTKLDLTKIEQYILRLDQEFDIEFCAIDPWQAELLGQRLEQDSEHRRRNQRRIFNSQPWVRAVQPTAANLRQQASLTIESFTDRRLKLYDYPPLRTDLEKLRVEERPGGSFRLTSPRDNTGHGDSFSAFALALMMAHEVAGKKPAQAGIVGVWGTSGGEFFEGLPGNSLESGPAPYNTDNSGTWILPGDPRSPKTGSAAYDLALQEFQHAQREYAEEQRQLNRPNDDQEPFRELMRHFGRSL